MSVLSLATLKKVHATRRRGVVIRRLSNKLGLLYFGTVDQNRDEHEVIRGITTSITHTDRHYSVGSYDGYDIAIVDRYDTTKHAAGVTQQNWCIIEISLHEKAPLPPIFFLPAHHEASYTHFFSNSRHLVPIHDFLQMPLSEEFRTRYTLYGLPHMMQSVNQTFLSELTRGIGAHFWPAALELKEDKLYITLTEHRLTETVLGSAIESALWLADALDQLKD